MNRLVRFVLTLPVEIFTGSLDLLTRLLGELQESVDETSKQLLSPTTGQDNHEPVQSNNTEPIRPTHIQSLVDQTVRHETAELSRTKHVANNIVTIKKDEIMSYTDSDSNSLEGRTLKVIEYRVVFTKYGQEKVLADGSIAVKEPLTSGMFERMVLKKESDAIDEALDGLDETLDSVDPDDIWVQYTVVSTRDREDPKFEEKQTNAQGDIVKVLKQIKKKMK